MIQDMASLVITLKLSDRRNMFKNILYVFKVSHSHGREIKRMNVEVHARI